MPGSVRVAGAYVAFDARPEGYVAGTNTAIAANRRLGASVVSLGPAFDRFRASVSSSLIATAAYAVGVGLVTRAVGGSVSGFIEFESGLIGVRKTAGLTAEATDRLGRGIRRITTSTSELVRGGPLPVLRQDLVDIAVVAGQMNIKGTRDILAFTEVVAGLGLTTDLVGEDAANALGKIIATTDSTVASVRNIASAITGLGNAFRGGEGDIISQATLLATQTAAFNLPTKEVLAFSAALAAGGQRPETAGTAFQRLFQTLTDAAAEAAGGNLTRLGLIAQNLSDDYGTLQERLELLRNTIQSGDYTGGALLFLEALKEAGPSGAGGLLTGLFGGSTPPTRLAGIFGFLADNIEETTRALDISGKSWEDIAVFLDEVGLFADGTRARLIAAGNEIRDQGLNIGKALTPALLFTAQNFRVLEFAAISFGAALAIGFGKRTIGNIARSAAAIKLAAVAEHRAASTAVVNASQRVKASQTVLRQNVFTSDRIATAERKLATARRVSARAQTSNFRKYAALNVQDRQRELKAARAGARARTQAGTAIIGQRDALTKAQTRFAASNLQVARTANIGRRALAGVARGISFLGGPLGLITLALTVGATAWQLWGRSVDEQKDRIDGLVGSLADLSQRRTDSQSGLTPGGTQLREAQEVLQELQDEVEALDEKRARLGTGTLALSQARVIDRDGEEARAVIASITDELEKLGIEGETVKETMGEIEFALTQGAMNGAEAFRGLNTTIGLVASQVATFTATLSDRLRQETEDAQLDVDVAGLGPVEESLLRLRSQYARLETERETAARASLATANADLINTRSLAAEASNRVKSLQEAGFFGTELLEQTEKESEQLDKQLISREQAVDTARALLRLLERTGSVVSDDALANLARTRFEATVRELSAHRPEFAIPDTTAARREAEDFTHSLRQQLLVQREQVQLELELLSAGDRTAGGIRARLRIQRTQEALERELLFVGDRTAAGLRARAEVEQAFAREVSEAQRAAAIAAREQGDAVSRLAELERLLTDATDEQELAIRREINAQRDRQALAGIEQTEAEARIAALEGQRASVDGLAGSVENLARAAFRNPLQQLADQGIDVRAALDGASADAERLQDVLASVGAEGLRSFRSELVSIFEDGEFALDNFLTSIATDLVGRVIDITIVPNIAAVLDSFLPSIATGAAGEAGLVAAGTSLTAAGGSLTAAGGTLTAGGGSITAGGTSLVTAGGTLGAAASALLGAASALTASAATGLAGIFHEGGVAGRPVVRRSLRSSLGPREVVTVLEKGEAVVSNQMRGRPALEIGQWVKGLPRYHSGGVAGRAGAASRGEAMPSIEVNVNNTSRNAEVEVPDNGLRFDGEKYVLNVIVKDQRFNGPITQGFKRMVGA